MAEFIKVADVDDLEDPGKTILEVSDRIVVLIKANGPASYTHLTLPTIYSV